MSYDIALSVRAEVPNNYGDRHVVVRRPQYDAPTYNYRQMFVAATGWNYSQSDDGGGTMYYMAEEALVYLKRGLLRLRGNPEAFRKYEPSNGWGTVEGATRCLSSWVRELTDPEELDLGDPLRYESALLEWPIEALWWSW